MQKLALLIVFSFKAFYLHAQQETEPVISNTQFSFTSNALYGKITEGSTKKGLPGVSVQLYLPVKKAIVTDSMIGGQFTRANGDFRFSNLPAADSFKIIITAVGYASQERYLRLSKGGEAKDLGNISLNPDPKTLAAVVVTAERPALQMGIDRRVFNVDKSITSTGGTAVDVMKNIPSVNVDVDGNVTLRNATPQIFVDGRPTILTMDQIPAENIEKIEIITNPSARFDAASTGGILNVVLKKNARLGLNGIASIAGGHPGIFNSNLNVNIRQGKVNLFASANYNQSAGKAKGRTLRQNKNAGVIDNYFNQYSINERFRQFASLRVGMDFFADNRNTFSISQGLVKGKSRNEQLQDQEYLNTDKTLERFGKRISEGNSTFNRYNTQLNFIHKFPQPEKELTASVNYNYGSGDNKTNILNSFFFPDGSPYDDPSRVRNQGENDNDQVTFQLDFVNPYGEDAKLETGVRSYINSYHNLFATYAELNGGETKLPLSNNIRYREMVNAFYLTYSKEMKAFSYQAGLRAEYSKFDGELIDSSKKFGYEYPNGIKQVFDALFPSLFLTKQLSDDIEMQLNFSRRIRRPNFWQLNPFVDINDPVNISQGNPQLRPEFTNAFEWNYNQKYQGGNFLGSLYYRNSRGNITRYSDTITNEQYLRLNQAAVDPNAILNTFINAQSTNRLGLELTLQQKLGSAFEMTPTVSVEYQRVHADINNVNLSNEGFNWEAKMVMNYRFEKEQSSFLKNFSVQLMGEYESAQVTPQGRELSEYSVDLGLRKEFLKNKKGTLSLSINDLFNTDRYGALYDTESFYQTAYGRGNVRNYRLTFSYKFGSSEFNLFERNNRDDDDN